ncbi:MAG: ATP-binding protein [bacterium]|nr:ATP-binding protein [bacterium]
MIWYGKTKSHFQQQSIRDLISGRYTTLILFRSDDRSPFEYAGIGHPLPHKNTLYPVRIDWKIERSSYNTGDSNGHKPEFQSLPLQRDAFLDAIASLNVHHQGETEASYKALLLLTMIARAEAGLDASVSYQDLMPHLRALVDRWKLTPESVDPRLPFWHLQEPHLWEIPYAANIPRVANGRPTARMLIEFGARGRIPTEHWIPLCESKSYRDSARWILLHRFWKPNEHEAVLSATAAAEAIASDSTDTTATSATTLNQETKNMTVRLVDDARAILSMRESDFDAYSAYGEVVDNSIQAESSFSRIRVNASSQRSGRSYRAINEIAFGDDGIGMNAETLHRCLQLGYSTR